MAGRHASGASARVRLVVAAWVVTAGAATLSLLPSHAASAAGFTVQAVSDGQVTATQLAAELAGPGVTISAATITGTPAAVAGFSGGAGVVGLDSGVALSTGFLGVPDPISPACPNSLTGPNDVPNASCENDQPADTDLNGLVVGDPVEADAAVLEFDVVPNTAELAFNYVFGSEEYNEFVNAGFNDVFALFVNGTNCATVPGSNLPVSVDNINGGNPIGTGATHPELYKDNDSEDFSGTPPYDTQLDGLTVPLTCTAAVTPGTTNHVKLAIEDIGDTTYDSVVMIQAGSFTSGTATSLSIEPQSSVQYSDVLSAIVHLSGPDNPSGFPVTVSIGTSSQTLDTDANGDVEAALKVLRPTGSRTITASFAGTTDLLPSQKTATTNVTGEDCVLSYSGATAAVEGTKATIAGTLGETDDSVGDLSGHIIGFSVVDPNHNEHHYTAITNSTGEAKLKIPVVAGVWQVQPTFGGDTFYSACDGETWTLTVAPLSGGTAPAALAIVSAPGSVQYSDGLPVTVGLAPVGSPDAPIAGATVVAALGSSTETAITDATGLATLTVPAKDPAGAKKLRVRFPGDGIYAPTAATQAVDVLREDTALSYTGDVAGSADAPVTLKARLGELDKSVGNLSGRTIAFVLDRGSHHRTVTGTTNGHGTATAPAALGAGQWSVRPTFTGDGRYLPATGSAAQIAVVPSVGTFGPGPKNPAPPPPVAPAGNPGGNSGGSSGGNPGVSPDAGGAGQHNGTHVLGRKVTRPTPAPSSSGATGGSTQGSGDSSGEAARAEPEHDFSQPAFVIGIPDVHEVSLASTAVLVNGLLALLMLMLIAFPAELFNGTLKENYDEVRGWFGPITRRLQRIESSSFAQSSLGRFAGGVAFVALTGIVYGFVEPGFGLDRESVQLVLALTVGLVIITVLANESALLFGRLRYGAHGRLRLRPGALLVALGCVLLSRAANFEPGYVYGLVAGFTFSRELPRRQDGQVVLAWASWLMALGVGGWLLLAPAKSWAEQHGSNFLAPVVEELTAAVVVESLTILILALVPLSFLEGERLWKARKLTWAVVYGLALFAFLHVVVHPEFGARKTELPLYTWLGFFLGFAVLSVSFWAYFRFRKHDEHAAA